MIERLSINDILGFCACKYIKMDTDWMDEPKKSGWQQCPQRERSDKNKSKKYKFVLDKQ